MTDSNPLLTDMNDRSREVFRRIVEGYLSNGEPVGSRTLTRTLSEKVSAATVRNVMQDLEYLGLLGSPHVSAGRVPTQMGLRMFVDSLLEVDDVATTDRAKIDATVDKNSNDVTEILDRVGSALSGITQGASLVLTPKEEAAIEHIEFVSLSPDRALVVLVFADGRVENRLFTPPPGQTPSSMREAANFLNAVMAGRTLSEVETVIRREISERRQEIDTLARALVESGLAVWENHGERHERLIVRGRSNLLAEEAEAEELERIRTLFDDLERKRDIADKPVDELAELRAERDELRDRFMRALADAENARKRSDRDRKEAENYGGSKLARDLLPVYDNMKRAVEAASDEQREVSAALIEGVELTMRELINVFAKHGIVPVSPEVGDRFDPQMHQAMFEAPLPDTKAGDIIQVAAEGFMLHDRLLRPAQVGVSSNPG